MPIDHGLLYKTQVVVSKDNATHLGDVHAVLEIGDRIGEQQHRLPCWPCQLADSEYILVRCLSVAFLFGLHHPLFIGGNPR